jgi:phosphate transport system substrate-binding protein
VNIQLRQLIKCFIGSFFATYALSTFAEDLRIGGSTTALPIISSCASKFMEKFPTWDIADSTLPNETTIIEVTGGGSGFGVKRLESGVIELGMLSRELKDTEIKSLGEPVAYVFARDAAVIATNTKNPLAKVRKDFTIAELSAIFSGKINQYPQIDKKLPSKPITLLTRNTSGGTIEIFKQNVLKEDSFSAYRFQLSSTAALNKKIETNDSAIGLTAAGSISHNEKIKSYSIDGIAATNENILSNKYLLNKPLLIVTKANPSKSSQLFIDYVLQGECQAKVDELGFIPVNPDEQ